MDSELQIALIAAGIGAVVLIVGYNKWQEHKHRRKAEKTFRAEHRDVLLEMHGDSAPANADGRREPRLGDSVEDERLPSAPRPVHEAQLKRGAPNIPDQLDPRADCIIRLETVDSFDIERLWALQLAQLQGLSKPVRWFAFSDDDNRWHPINGESSGSCHWFCAALQLVDRKGSIGEHDFMRFSGGVQRVADQITALPPALPGSAETLRLANELDRFCADVDIQIGVNLLAAETPFNAEDIARFALGQDLVLAADGRFHAVSDDDRSLFSLGNLEAAPFVDGKLESLTTRGTTLVIDVPLVRDGIAAFDQMMNFAHHFAAEFDGRIVDDNHVAFGSEAASLIREQIDHFQQLMAQQGIAAGSSLALRLFAS